MNCNIFLGHYWRIGFHSLFMVLRFMMKEKTYAGSLVLFGFPLLIAFFFLSGIISLPVIACMSPAETVKEWLLTVLKTNQSDVFKG